MGPAALEPIQFTSGRDGVVLAGEEVGEGPAIIALHGLTAGRRYLVHGSRVLPRKGFRLISYDARGHGASSPAPADGGYGYPDLAADLDAVIEDRAGDGPVILAGHSMGAHTLIAHALDAPPGRIAGIVVVGPAVVGGPASAESLAYWDRLADGLERGGVEGFVAAYDDGLDPGWRDRVLEITRIRLGIHKDPDAVARALREVPRSQPFDGLVDLEHLDVPALVVASHDTADPGHPYAVAEAWAARLPQATLIVEGEGESPLAWQGGKLSREIAAFAASKPVGERFGAWPSAG